MRARRRARSAMDCCNYEYRAYGAGAGWDGYYAPPPYAPYAPAYYAPHTHDPYARYYRYDYPGHHVQHAEHVMPMDYSAYASKEARVRRALSRREQRAHTPAPHVPTPSIECGMNSRGPAYCEPQMWPHYQMGVMGGGGWGGASAAGNGWAPRSACARDQMRYLSDCRPIKGPHMPSQNPSCHQDGRTTPFPGYEEQFFNGDCGSRHRNTPEFTPSMPRAETPRSGRSRFAEESRRSPPEEKRQPPVPVVPLPAFQQAFGSTEIGKFAEAFSRTEVAIDDSSGDNFLYEAFPDWEATTEPQWSSQPTSREIKCEENY